MADTKTPNVLDSIINGSYDPLGANSVPSPLLPAQNSSPVTAPTTPALPSLSTQDQSTADDAQPNSGHEGDATALSPDEHVGILKTIGRLAANAGRVAAGATGLESPNSSPEAGMGAKVMGLLGKIGTAGALAVGTPAQKSAALEQEQIPLKMQQMQNEAQYRNGMLGIGRQNADTKGQTADTGTAAEQGRFGSPALSIPGTANLTAQAVQARARSTQQMADEHTKQIEASLKGQVHVDPNLAHALGRDDLANQDIAPIAYHQQIGNIVTSRGFHTIDTGKDGTENGQWVVDNVGRKIYQISAFSPAATRGAAYGANRPVQALNPSTGMPEWETAGVAEGSHAAPVASGMQIMSKQAQFTDIYSGIGSMRAAINGLGKDPLDAATIGKLVMASRETDPTIFHQAIDTILGSEQLTPAQQDFIVAQRQLQERVMSLRNLAGMGNASDSLRAAITATLPTAKSGNVTLMRKQLDSVTNLVDNLHTGIPNINVPKPGTTVPKGPVSLQEAQQYLQKAGGDANKARALAKQDGRSF